MSEWADELLKQVREERRARQLREQIEQTKQKGRDNPELDNKDQLRELGREHHKITGTGGGAT